MNQLVKNFRNSLDKPNISPGFKHTDKARHNNSLARKKYFATLEGQLQLKKAHTAAYTSDARIKRSKSLKEYLATPKGREQILNSIGLANRASHTPEAEAKRANSVRKAWQRPEVRKKYEEYHKSPKGKEAAIHRGKLGGAKQKSPKARQRVREEMQFRWQNPEYNERVRHSISAALRTPETRRHRSELTTTQWQDLVFREEMRQFRLALWQDEEFRTKAVNAATVAARTPRRRVRQSEITRSLWADPNSKYNSKEFQEKFNESGYGKRKYASDGHRCDSLFEFIFEEWLIAHGLKHEPHPRIYNNNGKKADQLVNGHYIEIDGMNRGQEYWKEKYKGTGITPIIITNKKSLNDQLLSILTGKK